MESQLLRLTRFNIIVAILLLVAIGCSSGKSSDNPIAPQAPFERAGPGNLDALPIIAFDGETAISVMGGYNLSISNDGTSVNLVPMRSSAIGEDYIVSGMAFFVMTPCLDCLKITSIALDFNENIVLGFAVKHPLPKGDPSKPASAGNRLDLDVFDLALVVNPLDISPVSYSLTNASAFTGVVLNADGYTNELKCVTETDSVLPYKICYENENKNRFKMGTGYQPFDIVFSRDAGLTFDLYLTMAYGISARLGTRLTPIYYVPEFNRKAAWKIQVDPVMWYTSNPSTVEVDIYDWNHGATVAGEYPDPAHTNYIRASSDVQSVTVEVPGMTNTIQTAILTDSTTDGWDDPLTYSATFTNENLLSDGLYTGIVKVVDSRTPGIPGASDSLMHFPDGSATNIESYSIPEFATYQTFVASVFWNNPPVWDDSVGIQSATAYNAKITVTFGTATDPDGDNPVTYDLYYTDESNTGNSDPFSAPNLVVQNITSPYEVTDLINYHTYWLGVRAKDSKGLSETNTEKKSATPETEPSGNLMWAKRAGGADVDGATAITALSDDSVVVAGSFFGSATFGEDETNEQVLTSAGSYDIFIARYNFDGTLAWAKRAGSSAFDIGLAIATSSDNSTVVTGNIGGVATFGKGEANETTLTSSGYNDIFVARYNPDGTLEWAKRAGGALCDVGYGIATLSNNSTVVTGVFAGVATFGQDEPNQTTMVSAGCHDVFVARYDSDGALEWVKSAGGLSTQSSSNVAALSDNSTVVMGYFANSSTFGAGETNEQVLTSTGLMDIFIARYNSDGTLAWAKQAGGLDADVGMGITKLLDNSTIITGAYSGSSTFGSGEPNEIVLNSSGSADIFLARYDSNGMLKWAKSAGGASGDDGGNAITMLFGNLVVVTGYFSGSATFGPGETNETILTSTGAQDIFIARYNFGGLLMWVKSAGGISSDTGLGITAFLNNSTIVAGKFQDSATFGKGEVNQTTLTSAGYEDIFVARFAP